MLKGHYFVLFLLFLIIFINIVRVSTDCKYIENKVTGNIDCGGTCEGDNFCREAFSDAGSRCKCALFLRRVAHPCNVIFNQTTQHEECVGSCPNKGLAGQCCLIDFRNSACECKADALCFRTEPR